MEDTASKIDISTFLWTVGILLAVVGALAGLLWAVVWSAIKNARDNIKDLYGKVGEEREHCEGKFSIMDGKLEAERTARQAADDQERQERTSKHDATAQRMFDEVEKVKEKNSDLSETVAGFGTIYATRRELDNLRE